jgi:hypothetical protein
MNLWIRTGCFLTGWNRHILKSCSEASYKHLKKYSAALFILIILWAFTGYCFADRYLHSPWWGCVISSAIFVAVVIQVERQIILTVGHTPGIIGFRVFIAVIMSLLGSSIIDQIIFADDIDKKMIEITDRKVEELFPVRRDLYDSELKRVQIMIDSLDRMNLRLNAEIANKPTIITIATHTTYLTVTGSRGKDSIVPKTNVSKIPIPNPQIEQVKTNESNLKLFREQQKDFTEKKITAKEDLRRELSSKSGFLEELSAMFEILGNKVEALIFYVIIFCFLVSLELFVVFSKLWDKKCDYDLIVEYQLKAKLLMLEQLSKTKNR